MKLRWLPFAAALLVTVRLSAEEQAGAFPTVVAQEGIGAMACGPCSLLNSLRLGGKAERQAAAARKGATDLDRVKAIIEDYGRKPSDVYPDRPRYREKGGMSDLELLGMVNDVLTEASLPKAEGASLDRTKAEAAGTHLRKVHGLLRRSLDAGFPPIVILRSFVVKAVEKPKKDVVPFEWWGVSGHWVSVIDLPKELEAGAMSFVMRVADSWTGSIQQCFIHEEQFRNFTAAKGDDRKWTWPTVPQPYLIATLPVISLGVKETPWYLRSNIVLSYGIFRK